MTDISFAGVDQRRLAVASQWQLMWWAFRRHRLAMIGLVVTIALYIVAIAPGFFAVNDPNQQNGRAAYHPPQALHIIDTNPDGSWSFGLYFRPYQLRRDPQTLAAIYTEDPNRKIAIRLFGEGYQYNFLGLFPTRIHLLASAEPRQPLFLFGADRLGRCVFSRIVQGTQISLSVGLVGVFLSLTLAC